MKQVLIRVRLVTQDAEPLNAALEIIEKAGVRHRPMGLFEIALIGELKDLLQVYSLISQKMEAMGFHSVLVDIGVEEDRTPAPRRHYA